MAEYATDVLIDLIDQYLGVRAESGEIFDLKQRIEKLEEVLLGETAAWEKKMILSGNY